MKTKHLFPALCFSALVIPHAAQAVIPDTQEIVFDIYRNGSLFGEHRVAFDREGERTFVDIDINMKYALGPVTLFRYEHQNKEVWSGDEILSMDSQTNDDGTAYNVDAQWGKELDVEVNGEAYEAPPSIYSTSYWNPVALKSGQLLNSQKGQIEDVNVTYVGQDTIQTENESVKADHYKIDASVPLEVWYDTETKQWVGLKFSVRGSEIEYKRKTPVK